MKSSNLGFLASGAILGFVIGVSTATLTPMSLKGNLTPGQLASSPGPTRPGATEPAPTPTTDDASTRRTCYAFARGGTCTAVTVPATKTCGEYDPPMFDREDCTNSTPDLPGNQPTQPVGTMPGERPGVDSSASTAPADAAPPTANNPTTNTKIINCWGLHTPQGGINCTTGYSPVVRDDGTTCYSFSPRMYTSTEECRADRPAAAQ